MLRAIAPTPAELRASLPGDGLVERPDVVMDRAFGVDASPELVWPWLVQLGKRRAGWYLPRSVERVLPSSRRAIRSVEPRWQRLQVGDVIPDYGGRDANFEVALVDPPSALVFVSRRGSVHVSWALALGPEGERGTRVHLRLALGPVKHRWLANSVGDLFDALTIAGMAAGLRERLAEVTN